MRLLDRHELRTHPSSRTAFRGLVVAFGVSAIGFGTMAPFLVLWGHRDAGLSGAVAGLLFIAQAAGEITGGLAGGLLADRFGGRQVLLGSTVGMALAYGSLALVGAPVAAIAVLFLAGLFEAAYHPTAFALVGDLKPEDERTHAYGVIRAAGNVGTILGPLAGAAVVAGASVADVFLAAGALLAASGRRPGASPCPPRRAASTSRRRPRSSRRRSAASRRSPATAGSACSSSAAALLDDHARLVGGRRPGDRRAASAPSARRGSRSCSPSRRRSRSSSRSRSRG